MEASFFYGEEQWKCITKGTLFESVLYAFRKPLDSEVLCELQFANDSPEETIVHTDFQFGTVEEAMQAGVEFAIKSIDEG